MYNTKHFVDLSQQASVLYLFPYHLLILFSEKEGRNLENFRVWGLSLWGPEVLWSFWEQFVILDQVVFKIYR